MRVQRNQRRRAGRPGNGRCHFPWSDDSTRRNIRSKTVRQFARKRAQRSHNIDKKGQGADKLLTAGRAGVACAVSGRKKYGMHHQHDADPDQRDDVRHEIGINHERDAAEQRQAAHAAACRRARSPHRWSRTTDPTAESTQLISPTSRRTAPARLTGSLCGPERVTKSSICVGPPALCAVTRYLPLMIEGGRAIDTVSLHQVLIVAHLSIDAEGFRGLQKFRRRHACLISDKSARRPRWSACAT